MPTLKTSILAAVSLLVVAVRSYDIDPNSVSLSDRKQWCTSELSTCPLICDQTPPYGTKSNTCDPISLSYTCVCGNGNTPNISEYSLTIPYYICQQWGTQCVQNCDGDNTCANSCREDHPCGARDPSHNASSTATNTPSSASSTADASGQIYSGLGGGAAPTSATQKSFAAPKFDASHSLVVTVITLGGLAAGIALIL